MATVMATWERQTARRAPRAVRNLGGIGAAVLVLLLAVGTLEASRLSMLRALRAPKEQRATTPQPQTEAKTSISERAQRIQPARSIAVQTNRNFIVIFGDFSRRDEAEIYARKVRSKGYLAGVVPAGQAFRVVSHPYASQERAEFWTAIFQEIGLEVRSTTL